jgi:uncharacterized membrane protein
MNRDPSTREGEAPGLSPTVMAQLFRGELSRSDTWRTRLDQTTNWALTVTAASVSFSFSDKYSSHVILLVGLFMVSAFLILEARRYRYYDLWNRRLRLIEGGYWSPLLRKEPVDPDAMRELAAELARPQLQLSYFSALATRLNRAYGPIILALLITWFVKVYSHPTQAKSWEEIVERAHVGPVPGGVVVVALVLATFVFIFAFVSALVSRPPLGELRPRPRSRRLALWEVMFRPYAVPSPASRRRSAARRRSRPPA